MRRDRAERAGNRRPDRGLMLGEGRCLQRLEEDAPIMAMGLATHLADPAARHDRGKVR